MQVNSLGIIATIAGTSLVGYSGDRGAATSALLNFPISVAATYAGEVYIADSYNNAIRMVCLFCSPSIHPSPRFTTSLYPPPQPQFFYNFCCPGELNRLHLHSCRPTKWNECGLVCWRGNNGSALFSRRYRFVIHW